MANNFIGGPSFSGNIAFEVKDEKGNVRKKYSKPNAVHWIRPFAAQILLGTTFYSLTHSSQYSMYALNNALTDFKTNQTQASSDGGPSNRTGMAVYPDADLYASGGTILAVSMENTTLASTNTSYDFRLIGTGSFLSDGPCKYFNFGAQWNASNWENEGYQTIPRGFAFDYFKHSLGGGSFNVSSGDTITVSWDITLS